MTKTFWLSFCDPDAPAGQQFRGVCVVDVDDADAGTAAIDLAARFPNAQPGAEWIAAAMRKAWREGCNPGGEVATMELAPEALAAAPPIPRNRLLQKDELRACGVDL